MANSPRMVLRYYLRVCLFFPMPGYAAIFWTDSYLLISLTLISLLAIPLHLFWMRKRYGPFLAFLTCVYAFQVMICIGASQLRMAAHHTEEAVKPDTPVETISVVITAHNEHQYLKRTIDSILQTTPPEILLEIIVIDDGSQPPLEPGFEQVHLLRHEERRGLTKSKMEGGNMARGDMIMFLDAHVKPHNGWYKALLRHVNINYKRVVVPLIPILDGDTWKTNNMAVGVKMMFDWKLHFTWLDDGTDLVPCMSGGLFGITKRWWHESGEYDYGMNMWGAENIEQSIRIWLCGGEIFVARDSRIAHEVIVNKVRAVEAWFDQYKAYFYHAEPAAKQFLPAMGNIDDRLALKERLQCKPFSWYVDKFHKVFERKGMVPRQSFQIRDEHTGFCLETTSNGDGLQEVQCNIDDVMFLFAFSPTRSLQSDLCLDADSEHKKKVGIAAKLAPCLKRWGVSRSSMQSWKFVKGYIRFGRICLESKAEGPLLLKACGHLKKGDGPFRLINHQVLPPETTQGTEW
eukprot:g10383.t1